MKPIIEYLITKSSVKKPNNLIDLARELFLDDTGNFCSRMIGARFALIENQQNAVTIQKFLEILIKLNENDFICAESMFSDYSIRDKNKKYVDVKNKKFYFLDNFGNLLILRTFNLNKNMLYKIFVNDEKLNITKCKGLLNSDVYEEYWEGKTTDVSIYNTSQSFSDLDKIIEEII